MGGQVRLEPFPLGSRGITALSIGTIRIERNDMPGANIETVIPLAWGACSRAKVLKIAGRAGIGAVAIRPARRQVLVVPNRGMGNR